MRSGISFTVLSRDHQQLQAIVAPPPKSPQKHAWRARIVLLNGPAGRSTFAPYNLSDVSTCGTD
jgi:hypothetical protein